MEPNGLCPPFCPAMEMDDDHCLSKETYEINSERVKVIYICLMFQNSLVFRLIKAAGTGSFFRFAGQIPIDRIALFVQLVQRNQGHIRRLPQILGAKGQRLSGRPDMLEQ